MFLVLSACAAPAAWTGEENTSERPDVATLSGYRLGSGDVVRIDVFGESDLSVEVRLSDGGTISYPFLGELRVGGLSVVELEQMIVTGLKGPYLVDPKVSATIVEYRQFFINGEVENPGGYPFQPGLTLRKAISLAGGFTERASHKKLFLIHDNDPSQQASRVDMDTRIRPGDVITVKQSLF